MNGQYAYTPLLWPSVLTVVLLITLAVYSWHHRSVPAALPFAFALLFGVLWAAGSVMEYAAVDVATKITWVKFQTAWQIPAATAATCFALEYAWPGRWLTRRNLVLLSIVPLLVIVAMLADDRYHLIWRGFGSWNGTVIALLGSLGWVAIFYSFGLVFLTFIVFGWLFLHSPQHRWPVVIMVAGHIGVRTVFVLDKADLLRSALPLDVLGLAFTSVMYAIALFGFRLFDPIPVARRTALDQLNAGILVLNPQERVVSLNPAAERILQVSASQARGQPIRELLSAYPDGSQVDPPATETEFDLGSGTQVRHYTLATSALKDFRGLEVGHLLLLHDGTEQKQAQAQILEQQRSLAMLREREQLARELHDSLGQTLAAAHLQASTARVLLAQGETSQTDECLEQLTDMTLAAEADVRQYLLGAKTGFWAGRRFFPAVREYVARFVQQYGLQVELIVPPQLEAQGLGPAIEVQLMRIIQEALSNVRKHAHAKSAQVIFTDSEPLVQIAIIDDGQGFDPAAVAGRAEGFGLQSMRERAETLGGFFEVASQPGQGTRVVVKLPVQREAVR